MDDTVELSERLGRAIAGSPQAARLHAARDALKAQKEVEQTLKDYQVQADKINALQQENKPVEVEDKHKLQELEDKLFGSEVFKEFTAAQVEYVDMMRKINQAIQKHLGETEDL